MRISTKIGLFSSNSKEEHRQALMTAGTSSSVSISQQMVVARRPLLLTTEEVDQEEAARLPHPSAEKKRMYEEETSIREGMVELPAMVPAFSNISFLKPLSSLISVQVTSTITPHPINMTASNEILQQSSSATPEEAARKKLRQ